MKTPTRQRINEATRRLCRMIAMLAHRQLLLLLVMVLVAVLGAKIMSASHASTPALSAEPEIGTLTAGAAARTDTAASGGKYVAFSAGSSQPQPQYIQIGVNPSAHSEPPDVDAYTQLAGRKPDLVYWFQSWGEPLYYSGQLSGIAAKGVITQITWSPEGYNLADLNAGKYDDYIKTQALAAKAYGKPLQIRLAHEMNGPWQTYCPCVSGQTDQQFIDFWRRTVGIFRANGATNVQWVWSPNAVLGNGALDAKAFDAMYPGDAYVDWVGLDGYNFGPPNNPWLSLLQVFKPSYDDITKLTNKPLMIAEWGSNEQGGDKAAWIRQGFLTDLPQQMPRIRSVNVFDRADKEADYTINSSPATLQAYREVVASPLYGGP